MDLSHAPKDPRHGPLPLWNRNWLDAYPPGVPSSLSYPSVPVSELLESAARRFPEASAALTNAIDALAPDVDRLDTEARTTLARALDYRAQCHFLQGEDSEADADFALLVGAEPSYAPDPASTTRKILDRFRKIQTARVAFVTFQADPQDAEIVWNGRRLGAGLPPEVAVLAGPFVLTARRECFAKLNGVVPVH